MTTTLKRHTKPSRTNAFIDLIEDITNATADEITVTKQHHDNDGNRYEVAVAGETIGWIFGKVGSNYRAHGPRLQVQLRDSVKWSTQTMTDSAPVKASSRSRIEAVYSLANRYYA